MYSWYNGLENDDPGGLDEDGQDNVDDEDEDSDEDDIKITIDHKEIDDAKTSYQVIMKKTCKPWTNDSRPFRKPRLLEYNNIWYFIYPSVSRHLD